MAMDNVSAANASMAQQKASASVNSATCKRCGCTSVAWVQSSKTQKWYLSESILGTPGKVIPLAHRPHFKVCGTGQSHCTFNCGCKKNH
jgi:hypothetical protein